MFPSRAKLEKVLASRMQCLGAALLLLSVPTCRAAVELLPDTTEAFDAYVTAAEKRLDARGHGSSFLWSDSLPAPQRQPLLRGEVLVQAGQGSGVAEVKSGLIHDWVGAVFVPGATLSKVLAVVQDYPHHNLIYRPEVEAAQIRSHQGDEFHVYMRIVKSKFLITDVLNTEHDIHFFNLDGKRVYSRSHSDRIAEVSDPGKPSEHELPVGNDRGLVWRMNSYWFFEERDGGTYLECEEISLSRNIPLGMGKILGPILHSVPAESLRNGLEETRHALSTR